MFGYIHAIHVSSTKAHMHNLITDMFVVNIGHMYIIHVDSHRLNILSNES